MHVFIQQTVSAVWYKFQELVLVIIFGEPVIKMKIFCPILVYTNKIETPPSFF